MYMVIIVCKLDNIQTSIRIYCPSFGSLKSTVFKFFYCICSFPSKAVLYLMTVEPSYLFMAVGTSMLHDSTIHNMIRALLTIVVVIFLANLFPGVLLTAF